MVSLGLRLLLTRNLSLLFIYMEYFQTIWVNAFGHMIRTGAS